MPHSFTRRTRAGLGAGLLVLAGCAAGEAPAERPQSIIILDVDTLRADHLGCYGYHLPTSPNIDALAAESVRFEWAFSQAPNTPPSQGAILSGLYPTAHGLILPEDRMREEVTTLAEALAAAGFTTAGFIDGGYMSAEFGIGQGFGHYYDNKGRGLAGMGPLVLDWLAEHAGERFLLLVHTYDVHTPYQPPQPFRSQFLDGRPPPASGFQATSKEMEAIRLSKYYADQPQVLSDEELAYAMALYDGEIRFVDDWVGSFMAAVRRLGLDRTALIVFLSDHGDEFQEHGSVLHEKLYATVTHIPLLMRFPGAARRAVIPTVVESVDVMPTLLEAVGVEEPPGLHGASLLPLIRGEAPQRPALAFGESPYFGVQRFVATNEFRLQISKQSNTIELYAYRDDPFEQRDLAPASARIVDRLLPAITRWEELVGRDDGGSRRSRPLSEETLRQLRALGYLP